jgi:hypothetical protein
MIIHEITIPEGEVEILDWEASQSKYQIEVQAYILNPDAEKKMLKVYKARIVDIASEVTDEKYKAEEFVSEWFGENYGNPDASIYELALAINKAMSPDNKTRVLDFKENHLPFYLTHSVGYRPVTE